MGKPHGNDGHRAWSAVCGKRLVLTLILRSALQLPLFPWCANGFLSEATSLCCVLIQPPDRTKSLALTTPTTEVLRQVHHISRCSSARGPQLVVPDQPHQLAGTEQPYQPRRPESRPGRITASTPTGGETQQNPQRQPLMPQGYRETDRHLSSTIDQLMVLTVSPRDAHSRQRRSGEN